MTIRKDNEPTDIVQAGATIAEFASLLFGLAALCTGMGPASAIVSGSAAIPAKIVPFLHGFEKRKQAQREARAQGLADILCRKFVNERVDCDDKQMDLYIEVIQRAITDDEDRKIPIYAAIIEWIIREKPSSLHVRLLSSGANQLAYTELYCILYELATKRAAQEVLELEGMRSVLWAKRIASHGLGEDGVRHIGTGTILANALAKYVDWNALVPPNRVAEQHHKR